MSTFRLPEHRDQLLLLAKVSEQAERFEEVLVAMKRIVRLAADLSPDERNLLSVAYKSLISFRRASWRIVSSAEDKDTGTYAHVIGTYKMQLESEITEIAQDFLSLLEKYLLPGASTEDSKAFFYKTKGDYLRYLCEISSNAEYCDRCLESYSKALEYCSGERASSSRKLGTVLNYAVCLYEIMNEREKAITVSKSAFDAAIVEIDANTSNEDEYSESLSILRLIRDNLYMWTQEGSP